MSTATKPTKAAAPKKTTTSGPSYEAMIKEAILAHPEEARGGLSRPLIKKFLHTKHPATSKISEASFNNHISRAIKSGADKKTFTLPKGPSGKVKLSAAAKAAPKKKPAAKKPATKKPTVKKTAAKKKTTTAKKPAAKKTKSSTAAKAKKPAAKKTATKPKTAATKKVAAPKKA